MFRKKFSSKGFTLVEITLVVAIVAFVLCGILATYISCFVLAATSKNIGIATNAALGLVEEIRNAPFSQIITDYDGLNFIVNDIPASRGVVYVSDDNPELLRVTVSVCWRQGQRIIGEDTNLDGVLNAGEDANGNGLIDSTVQIVTLVANK